MPKRKLIKANKAILRASSSISSSSTAWDNSESAKLKSRLIAAAVADNDLDALRSLGISAGGFVSREWRRVAWYKLLADSCESAEVSGAASVAVHARVIEADVQRCACHWDVHLKQRKTRLRQRRLELSRLIHSAIGNNEEYYQGLHEIALVVQEVSGNITTSQAILKGLIKQKIGNFLTTPFNESLLPLLDQLQSEIGDSDISEFHFAIPWILTWFSHNVHQIAVIERIFDFLICSADSYHAVVQLSAALLMVNRKSITQVEDDDSCSLLSFIQALPASLDLRNTELVISLAIDLNTSRVSLTSPPRAISSNRGHILGLVAVFVAALVCAFWSSR